MIPEIRAMQVVGLAGEVFYLTMFQGPLPEYDLRRRCPANPRLAAL